MKLTGNQAQVLIDLEEEETIQISVSKTGKEHSEIELHHFTYTTTQHSCYSRIFYCSENWYIVTEKLKFEYILPQNDLPYGVFMISTQGDKTTPFLTFENCVSLKVLSKEEEKELVKF